MPLIQPYELFGLTSAASMDEVRKAYYNMALFCHPDRGGSAEEMAVVTAAYKWIIQGLREVKPVPDIAIEYDQLLAEYKPEHIPTFLELQGENFGLSRSAFPDIDDFMYRMILLKWQNEKPEIWTQTTIDAYARRYIAEFTQQKDTTTYPASIPHGYKSIMTTQEEEPLHEYTKASAMTVYVEPGGNRAQAQPADIIPVDKMDDYSTRTCSDYERAFSKQDPPISVGKRPYTTVEELCALRERDDSRMEPVQKTCRVAW
jgi:DnaJ domain